MTKWLISDCPFFSGSAGRNAVQYFSDVFLERQTSLTGVFMLERGDLLDTDSVVKILRYPQTILEGIPVGEKSNVYMTVNNESNLQRRARGQGVSLTTTVANGLLGVP